MAEGREDARNVQKEAIKLTINRLDCPDSIKDDIKHLIDSSGNATDFLRAFFVYMLLSMNEGNITYM